MNAQALKKLLPLHVPNRLQQTASLSFKEWWRKTFFSGHPDESQKEEPNYNYYNSPVTGFAHDDKADIALISRDL